MRLKKNRHKPYLDIVSFIVAIRPDSEYPADERNKLFSFSKSYFESYYFRYSHVLHRINTLEKSGSTCYPMILYKRDSTADIFL